MNSENLSEIEEQFDCLFQQMTEQKVNVKKLHDDDFLLICCLMAEIVRILHFSPGDT